MSPSDSVLRVSGMSECDDVFISEVSHERHQHTELKPRLSGDAEAEEKTPRLHGDDSTSLNHQPGASNTEKADSQLRTGSISFSVDESSVYLCQIVKLS